MLNPRNHRIVALPKPSETEQGQWYFQRYIAHLPNAGEMVFFDRSWYNRAGVEPVMGFVGRRDYEKFMRGYKFALGHPNVPQPGDYV